MQINNKLLIYIFLRCARRPYHDHASISLVCQTSIGVHRLVHEKWKQCALLTLRNFPHVWTETEAEFPPPGESTELKCARYCCSAACALPQFSERNCDVTKEFHLARSSFYVMEKNGERWTKKKEVIDDGETTLYHVTDI